MSRDSLTILATTSEVPWPLDSGGHLRTYHLLRALAKDCHVRLVTSGGPPEALSSLKDAGINARFVHDGRRRPRTEVLRALRAGVRGRPYVMYGRHDWMPVREALREEVRSHPPDVLYLDHLDAFVYADAVPSAIVVGDFHNVYSLLAARAAEEQRSWLRNAYLSREAKLLARMEKRAMRVAQLILTVSSLEEVYFRTLGGRNVHVVPNGVNCHQYADLPTGRLSGVPTILYVGAMSWLPNAAAVRYLALEVMPEVRANVPDARLKVVGRDPGREILALSDCPGVEITGRVDDVTPHLRDAHVLAVPLETGGGTRLKILEAFAAGLPVVSTPVGCEGIEVEDGRELRIAPRAEFAKVLTESLLHPERGARMAAAARALARDCYDWPIVGRIALDAIREVVEKQRSGQPADTRQAG